MSRDCRQKTGSGPGLSVNVVIPIRGDTRVIVIENLDLVRAKEVG